MDCIKKPMLKKPLPFLRVLIASSLFILGAACIANAEENGDTIDPPKTRASELFQSPVNRAANKPDKPKPPTVPTATVPTTLAPTVSTDSAQHTDSPITDGETTPQNNFESIGGTDALMAELLGTDTNNDEVRDDVEALINANTLFNSMQKYGLLHYARLYTRTLKVINNPESSQLATLDTLKHVQCLTWLFDENPKAALQALLPMDVLLTNSKVRLAADQKINSNFVGISYDAVETAQEACKGMDSYYGGLAAIAPTEQ